MDEEDFSDDPLGEAPLRSFPPTQPAETTRARPAATEVGDVADFSDDPLGDPPVRSLSLPERQEATRARLAIGLTSLFGVLVLGAGTAVWTGVPVDDVRDVLE